MNVATETLAPTPDLWWRLHSGAATSVDGRAQEDRSRATPPPHHRDTFVLVAFGQPVAHVPEARSVLEQRRDVREEDAFGGEVADVVELYS